MAKIVNDIYVHNGTSFVSVKGGSIKVHNGTAFVDMGTENSPIFDGGDWCYVLTVAPTFTVFGKVALSQTVMSMSIPFEANPAGTITVISKPKDLQVFVTSNSEILISINDYFSKWIGTVILRCSNAAPDVSVEVTEFIDQ